MQSMIIHMAATSARKDNVAQLCRDLPGAKVVAAVNGRDPAQIADVPVHPGSLFAPAYPFALTPPEIGVFQSHRRCWQMLVDSNEEFALIAEDDLAVDPPHLARALAMIASHARPDMYIRLPVKAREKAARVLASDGDMQLILPRQIGLQCICQVVGRGAAERLLAVTAAIDRPVDTLLQMHWLTGQPVHAVLPNSNREVAATIGGSTIQTRIHGPGKLLREARRAWYRARLALHPQR